MTRRQRSALFTVRESRQQRRRLSIARKLNATFRSPKLTRPTIRVRPPSSRNRPHPRLLARLPKWPRARPSRPERPRRDLDRFATPLMTCVEPPTSTSPKATARPDSRNLPDLQVSIGTRPNNFKATLRLRGIARDLRLDQQLYNWLAFGTATGATPPSAAPLMEEKLITRMIAIALKAKQDLDYALPRNGPLIALEALFRPSLISYGRPRAIRCSEGIADCSRK